MRGGSGQPRQEVLPPSIVLFALFLLHEARTGKSVPIVVIHEAGLDGFWIHRVLEQMQWIGMVLCTHGELIGQVFDRLIGDGLDLPGRPRWPKGSTWVLDRHGGARVAAASYLEPLVPH